ncbi:hypothetical protein [Aquicoccus porphyridii]|uniref:hypothetical protein n=1 Tax=Aquicoccus porphyridii TaxID=1852029 RepID=UPI00273D2604|nr:hypothetical protein [Aquicoccus porphyridii]
MNDSESGNAAPHPTAEEKRRALRRALDDGFFGTPGLLGQEGGGAASRAVQAAEAQGQ